ncbi:MAG TPA: PKD domain-containing protein [Longimicrobium sp.]|nr:PKD domain-containing protein [Longimicrobium sp.]
MTHQPAKHVLFAFFAACIAVLGACGGDSTAVDDPGLRVAIDPVEVDLGMGSSIPLRATVTASGETAAASRPVIWTAADSSVVSVSSEGLVTGRKIGVTRVFATVPGHSADATVRVVAPTVASVAVVPASATLAIGGTRQFGASVKDALGADRGDRTVFWSSDNEGVATVSPFTGVVTARTAGTARIIAAVDGKTGSAAVTVNASGTPAPNQVANQAPTASFTSACAALACTFADASTDGDGSVTAWNWSFGDGSSAAARNPAHSFAAAGTFTVTLTVTDNAGATASSAKQVTVTAPAAPRGPTASFAASCTNLVCAFTDQSTTTTGAVVAWSWELGNGAPVTTFRNEDAVYPAPGSYTVKLTVTDDQGQSATTTRTMVVTSTRDGVQLVNRASGQCMSVDTKNNVQGASLTVRACDGGDDQRFALPVGDAAGPVQLVRFGDRYLWLEQFSDEEDHVWSWRWTGAIAQRWTYTGTGQIRNMVTDTCLIPESGKKSLQTTSCTNAPAQQWERRP